MLARLNALTVPDWAWFPAIQAIRNGFLFCLPLVTAGALSILFNNLPLPGYQDFMKEVFGENWNRLGLVVWQGTFGVLSIPMLVGTSYHLAVLESRRNASNPVNPLVTALTAFVCLMVILPSGEEGGIMKYMGVPGLFVSILTAIAASRVFICLSRMKRLSMLIYSEGVDASIQQAFVVLVPSILTVCLFAAFYALFLWVFGASIHQIAHDALLWPFQFEGSWGMLQKSIPYVFFVDVFWFFGIHGSNTLDPLTRDLFGAAQLANEQALAMNLPPPYIVTKNFLDTFVFMGGSGASICLLVALFIGSRNRGSRRLAKISLLPGVFNINEILVFGLPIILNPIFFLPFVLVPLVLLGTSYLAVSSGLVPLPVREIGWTTPLIFGGYFSTGAVSGSLLQVVNLVLGTLIYIPFVCIYDHEKADRQKKTMRALMEVACANTVGPSGKKCFDRGDEISSLALALAHDMEQALKTGNGFYLEYQPQFDCESNTVIGAEALVRWRHPFYGLIPAPIMVAVAEDGGFMCPLGLWVLNKACAERARWRAAGINERFKTSVNVSIQQLGDEALADKVVACLARYGLPHHMIGLEVTESIALDPDSPHNLVLKELSEKKFIISMDDFGMGHSSLVYLKYFPIDILKIDKALSKDITSSKIGVEIVSTIVDLCRSLGVKIIVEYVETQEQIYMFRSLGCHVFQGYFYSPPISGESLLNYVFDMNCKKEGAAG